MFYGLFVSDLTHSFLDNLINFVKILWSFVNLDFFKCSHQPLLRSSLWIKNRCTTGEQVPPVEETKYNKEIVNILIIKITKIHREHHLYYLYTLKKLVFKFLLSWVGIEPGLQDLSFHVLPLDHKRGLYILYVTVLIK